MRWADMDQLGHVNNVVYVDYLQEARVDMLRGLRGTSATDELVDGVVVVRHEIGYRAPLVYRFAAVSIECWVTELRSASFTMAYEIFTELPDGDREVYLTATTVLAPYVFAEERPRRITPAERAFLEQHLEPDPRPRPVPIPAPVRDRLNHYPVHVRFSDVDVYRHVNNVKYLEYLQEARILYSARLWREVPPGTPPCTIVVAQADIDYRVPLTLRERPYDCWTWVARVGRTSFVVESEISEGEVVFARARVVIVFFDPATGRAGEPLPCHRDPFVAEGERVALTRTS